jgi:amino acid transporter
VKRTKIIKLKEMDLWSGKEAIDRLEPFWPERNPRNWLERIWFWIA